MESIHVFKKTNMGKKSTKRTRFTPLSKAMIGFKSSLELGGGDQNLHEKNKQPNQQTPLPLGCQDGKSEQLLAKFDIELEEDPCLGCNEPKSLCCCEDPYVWTECCRSCGHNSYTEYGCNNCGRDDPFKDDSDDDSRY